MYDEGAEEVFLGRSASQHAKTISDDTARAIDQEVRKIIDECYSEAHRLLEENRDKLDLMAEALMHFETIDAGQIDQIMQGKAPSPPADWSDDKPGGSNDGGQVPSSDEAVGPIGDPASEH